MVTYEENDDSVIRTEETGKTWSIPKNPENADYAAYLVWLEEQAPPQTPKSK
jgi:hypothetical protein